ncbi:hypothetical protein [Pseudomonas fluorescens]|uniref:hypothetical protein n=1 Tax=Pseudomonas fluorescens TaxID=294 RepID=UPI000F055C2C|nr:hypothetical protein [Pseudomonas fluorescens]VVN74547.1 hypothetical protein PS720_00643 [Pseudomonas fluorescens]
MSSETRRTINELLTRYELEPDLKDVYVEGQYDKDVFSVCLGGAGNFSEVIYDISTVNVPADALLEYNLSSGNKQRVLALAKKLSSLEFECAYRCIIDKDLDHWLDCLEDVPRLKWTEHTCIELYFFTKEIISHILITATRSKIKNMDVYLASVADVLKVLFAMRLADRKKDWGLTWLDPTKQFSVNGDVVLFNSAIYVVNLLAANKRAKELADFNVELEGWIKTLDGDPRGYIRGHDLVLLLAWTVKQFNGIKEFQNETALERAFILVADKAPELVALVR